MADDMGLPARQHTMPARCTVPHTLPHAVCPCSCMGRDVTAARVGIMSLFEAVVRCVAVPAPTLPRD